MLKAASAQAPLPPFPCAVPALRVLGVRLDAVQIPDVVARMVEWIERGESGRTIAVTGMHGVSEALTDPAFRRVLAGADLVVPDGMPLVWIGRLKGFPLRRRVYGPELMLDFCRATAPGGYRHYFYGGAPDIPDLLAHVLESRFPGLVVAGTFSPPFRALTDSEGNEVVRRINRSQPDVLWVGLSTPKQEVWMAEHRRRLRVPVIVGVGAAFDLNTGRVHQAPRWMREHGLEWSWRLLMEPRRLWRRYLLRGPRFAWNVALELCGLKRFE